MKNTNQKIEPMVSIIIVNYNGLTYLEKCLKSILENSYKNHEIIIVDNNSVDGSIDFIKKEFPEIKLIELDKNYGYAKPNNLGAKAAKGDFIFFLNNDTIISENTIEELLKVIQEPGISACQSLLIHPDKSIDSSGDFVNSSGIPFNSTNKSSEICPILSARGAAMMVKKDLFWTLQGFDEKFFVSFEDVEFGWKSWVLGYKVLLVPTSIVVHEGGVTVKKLPKIINFHGVKNFLILNLVYFERPLISSLIKLLFSFLTKKLSTNLKTNGNESFSLPTLGTSLRGFCWIIKNYNYIKNKKKAINLKRQLSTADLIKMKLIKEN